MTWKRLLEKGFPGKTAKHRLAPVAQAQPDMFAISLKLPQLPHLERVSKRKKQYLNLQSALHNVTMPTLGLEYLQIYTG